MFYWNHRKHYMRMEPLVEHHLGYVGCLFSVYTFIPFNLHNESFRLQLCRTIDFAPLKLSRATKRTRHLPMESQSGHNMLNVWTLTRTLVWNGYCIILKSKWLSKIRPLLVTFIHVHIFSHMVNDMGIPYIISWIGSDWWYYSVLSWSNKWDLPALQRWNNGRRNLQRCIK